MPILSFTPVFLLVTSFAILGEVPTVFGLAGICLVAAGSYMLAANGAPGRDSPRAAPFRTLLSDRGIQFMLIVAFLYSISVNYDKVVVEKSDPVLGSAVVFGLLAGIFLLWAAILQFSGKAAAPATRSGKRGDLLPLVALGLVLTAEAVSVNVAYTLSLVPMLLR